MTAKEYLNQARHLDALINCRLREIDYWRDLSSSVSGTRFDGMPHSPNRPTEAPFVRCLEKRDEQLVLRYRYLDDCTWEEISRMLNVSLRTVHRIHGSALQNFSVPD